jgi:hypothetical protein
LLNNNIKCALILSITFAAGSSASSFDEERQDQSIPVAGTLITPIFKFQQRYDSNVLSAKTDEINSWLTIFQPSVKLTKEFGEFGKHNLELDWVFTHGAYHATPNDSYNDHELTGKLNYEIDLRHRLMFQAGYIDAHEERGSRFSIGIGSQLIEPDRYDQIFGGVQYTFGAPTADMRLELELGYLDNNYRSVFEENVNTNVLTDVNATRDRTTAKYGGTFYYQVGSATDLTLEAWNSAINYDYTAVASEELSSIESQVLFGAQWEATALTTGFAKIGYKEKDFKLSTRNSFYALEWEAEILWEPKTYSKFTFRTGRTTEETNGEGFFFEDQFQGLADVIEGTLNSIEWKHEWKERLSSKITYAVYKDIYKGQTGTVRIDHNSGISAALYYDMNYWLSFSLDYTVNERESTREFLVYDRQLATLGVRIALF